jgi:hypothetical protein
MNFELASCQADPESTKSNSLALRGANSNTRQDRENGYFLTVMAPLSRIAGFVVGAILVTSGLSKVLTPVVTLEVVWQSYQRMPLELLAGVLVIMTAVEISIGVLLLNQGRDRPNIIARIGAVVLLSGFFGLSLWRFAGAEQDGCGCFGALNVWGGGVLGLVRDATFLLLAVAHCLPLAPIRISRIWIGILGPAILFGWLAAASVTTLEYRPQRNVKIDSHEENPAPIGLPVDRVGAQKAGDIVKQEFGLTASSHSFGQDESMFIVYRNSSRPVGWVMLRALPLPGRRIQLFQVAAVFDSSQSLVSLLSFIPQIPASKALVDAEDVAKVTNFLTRQDSDSFQSYKSLPDLRLKDSRIGIILLGFVNSSRLALLRLKMNG